MPRSHNSRRGETAAHLVGNGSCTSSSGCPKGGIWQSWFPAVIAARGQHSDTIHVGERMEARETCCRRGHSQPTLPRSTIHQDVRARMISASPTRKQPNIAVMSLVVSVGAVRNSFQMKRPQKAATVVAPCPRP